MEVNPAWTDRARQGLPDVVKERSQAKSPLGICLLDDGERVSENVLVPLDWVLLEGERRQLGKELLG
jgi:putative hemolysin